MINNSTLVILWWPLVLIFREGMTHFGCQYFMMDCLRIVHFYRFKLATDLVLVTKAMYTQTGVELNRHEIKPENVKLTQ